MKKNICFLARPMKINEFCSEVRLNYYNHTMKRFLVILSLLGIIFTFASCSKDDVNGDANGDEYYVKYSVSKSGSYELSYTYTDANGNRVSKRSKSTSFTVGPVYKGFCASIRVESGVWKNGCSIEISKNGGVWMPVASDRSSSHQGSYCSYTIK